MDSDIPKSSFDLINIKKPSLFAQRMGLKHKEIISGQVMASSIIEKSIDELQKLENLNVQYQKSGFPEAMKLEESFESVIPRVLIKNKELEEIQKNNLQKILEMSQEEIKEAMDEIESLVDPRMMEVLQKRGKRKINNFQRAPVKLENHVDLTENQLGIMMQETIKPTCLHVSEEPESQFEKVRFDYEGNTVQIYVDKE